MGSWLKERDEVSDIRLYVAPEIMEQMRCDHQTCEPSREIYMTDQVKILMVTVKNDSENIISSFREGCDGFLIKPVTPDKLCQALAKIGIVLEP